MTEWIKSKLSLKADSSSDGEDGEYEGRNVRKKVRDA